MMVFVFSCVYWVQHHLLNYLDTFIKSQSLYTCNSIYRLLKEPPSASLNCSLSLISKTRGLCLGSPSLLQAQTRLAVGSRAWHLCSLSRPVWCRLLSMCESSCLICFVLFPSFSQWKDKFHAPPSWKQNLFSPLVLQCGRSPHVCRHSEVFSVLFGAMVWCRVVCSIAFGSSAVDVPFGSLLHCPLLMLPLCFP